MFLKKQIFSKLGNSAPALGRITGDFAVNILASVIYTFARQIVVFPLLAARLPEDTYGTLLTVTGLVNVCTALVGNSLNNIRLVQNSQYEERGTSIFCVPWAVRARWFFPLCCGRCSPTTP